MTAPSPQGEAVGTASSTPSASVDRVPGVTFPAVPQRHAVMSVVALASADAAAVLAAAKRLSETELGVTPDAGDVTLTIGFSPSVALQLWPDRASLAAELPAFAGDVAGMATGGDLLLQVCAETIAAARGATARLLDAVADARLVWQQSGNRDAPTPEGTTRTNAGFIDGIINPRTGEELAAGVWVGATRDTYLVVRRMTIESSFLNASVDEQEQAIGRHRDSGAPLSGGSMMDEVDLFSKTDDGRVLTPLGAHARRAHPVNVGRPLMLRRSYSFDVADGAGLIFVACMNDPETFVVTQRRLDELDELIRHTTTDASGCFFVPETL